MFNVEASPTLNHLYNLKQNENERAGEFIHRWRSTCNRMKVPIPEEHALQIILNNFAQPLRNLISTSPAKSFIKLIERAEWLETGLDNGLYEGYPFVRGNPDQKKKAHTLLILQISQTTAVVLAARKSKKNRNKNVRHSRAERTNSAAQKGKFVKPQPVQSAPQPEAKQPEKPKHEGWSYDREFTALEQSREDILEYMMSKGMIKLPKVADPPVAMGKWTDKFCKFHRTVGHDTEHCFVLKNIIQDCIDKNLLIEDEDEQQPKILSKPFPKHSASVITEQTFSLQDSIQPCSSQDIQDQHQVLVLRQAQSSTKRVDITAFSSNKKPTKEPAKVTAEIAKLTPRIPKRFIKAASKKGETSGSVQKPITALSNISILDLTHASPEHQQVLEDLLRKIKVKPSTTPQDMAQIVNQAMTNAPITFSDEDLPKPHSFHNNALVYSGADQGHDSPSCAG